MTLRITKASDPITVAQIVTTIYGFPGSWKTSLAFTTHAPLLLDFDGGAHRAKYRKDTVQVAAWTDVTAITPASIAKYKTIIVDTAGRALDVLAADIQSPERDPKGKMGRGGALSLQGFGKLKGEFISWLKALRALGLDVVLMLHVDEQRSGDDILERIDAQGGSKNEIYKVSDAMGRIALRDGKRMLLFSPTDTAFGKNPGELTPLEIPTFGPESSWLGDVIDQIKVHLNRQSDEQTVWMQALIAWAERVKVCTTAAALTGLIAEAGTLEPTVVDNAKRVLASFAKQHGFTFDKKTGGFVEGK